MSLGAKSGQQGVTVKHYRKTFTSTAGQRKLCELQHLRPTTDEQKKLS